MHFDARVAVLEGIFFKTFLGVFGEIFFVVFQGWGVIRFQLSPFAEEFALSGGTSEELLLLGYPFLSWNPFWNGLSWRILLCLWFLMDWVQCFEAFVWWFCRFFFDFFLFNNLFAWSLDWLFDRSLSWVDAFVNLGGWQNQIAPLLRYNFKHHFRNADISFQCL